jgi:hypothetical protein
VKLLKGKRLKASDSNRAAGHSAGGGLGYRPRVAAGALARRPSGQHQLSYIPAADGGVGKVGLTGTRAPFDCYSPALHARRPGRLRKKTNAPHFWGPLHARWLGPAML